MTMSFWSFPRRMPDVGEPRFWDARKRGEAMGLPGRFPPLTTAEDCLALDRCGLGRVPPRVGAAATLGKDSRRRREEPAEPFRRMSVEPLPTMERGRRLLLPGSVVGARRVELGLGGGRRPTDRGARGPGCSGVTRDRKGVDWNGLVGDEKEEGGGKRVAILACGAAKGGRL
jgi:hypothetical protein